MPIDQDDLPPETASQQPILMFQTTTVVDLDPLSEAEIPGETEKEPDHRRQEGSHQEEIMTIDIDLHQEDGSVVHLQEGKENEREKELIQGTCFIRLVAQTID
jgi:hypothetical protein